MSSTNKTDYMGLNSWVGADIPKMEDFNTDNEILDSVISEHCNDSVSHVTSIDKEKWNSPVAVTTYFGDGSETRDIELECSFVPSFIIIFPNGAPTTLTFFDSKHKKNFFAFGTQGGSSSGISLSGKTVTLKNEELPKIQNEARDMNYLGTRYVCVMFR